MEENNITVDKAVQTIKGAILRAQAQASQSSNAIQLSLYYGIGHYVSINLQQAHWGAKALDTISERLQRELPGLRGFSSGNLKKMRIFYEEWQCLSIEGVSKRCILFFYKQNPDFHKPGLCHVQKNLYL